MAENEIFTALRSYGFNAVNENLCVGTWRDYAVTLQRFGGKTYYVYLAVRLGKVPSGLKKTLNASIKEPGVKLGGVERVMPNFVHCSFSFPKGEDPAARFAQRMEVITGALRQNGVYPANTCAVTGAANPDSLGLILRNDMFGYQPVCGAAVRSAETQAQQKVSENEDNGSYVTGLIGAVIGAAVGVAVNLALIILLKLLIALAFALVPIGAMFGYKLFKGKTDKVSIIIVIVLSILAVPLLMLLSLAVEAAKEFNIPFGEAFGWAWRNWSQKDVLSAISGDLVKMVLFMALGVFISFAYLRGSLNGNQTKRIRAQLDTLRPNPLYQAPAQTAGQPYGQAPVQNGYQDIPQPVNQPDMWK